MERKLRARDAEMETRVDAGMEPLHDKTHRLVLARKEYRGHAPVRLGDDPDFLLCCAHFVRAENSCSLRHGVVVGCAVVCIQRAPVAPLMTSE